MKTFEDILQNVPNIANDLKDHTRYWAHTHVTKKEELLKDHTGLVNTYSLKLVQAHGLDGVINTLISAHVTGWENEPLCADILKECFVGVIVFHDFGKVNENFQVLRMQNNNGFREQKIQF